MANSQNAKLYMGNRYYNSESITSSVLISCSISCEVLQNTTKGIAQIERPGNKIRTYFPLSFIFKEILRPWLVSALIHHELIYNLKKNITVFHIWWLESQQKQCAVYKLRHLYLHISKHTTVVIRNDPLISDDCQVFFSIFWKIFGKLMICCFTKLCTNFFLTLFKSWFLICLGSTTHFCQIAKIREKRITFLRFQLNVKSSYWEQNISCEQKIAI